MEVTHRVRKYLIFGLRNRLTEDVRFFTLGQSSARKLNIFSHDAQEV